ncbi:5-methyltetrahydropteroyltriglutamate--homocysteine S-methyltransferase [Mucilaginibacter phyllosphaerae]|uniref:5-methyltetrahydropteroyltriglutamate--homocysteine methyltransferase n=1 Tax=Mucilaginibacter phyllosphaerae TaxID=1812349 RepID=A0A4Y8A8P2_9SPHI|nr:5-methyltetrahydropteroyltriglutamate--homocysteine S-methyltransferase [Mucilaginibacter phyllosphaerae]MBB3970825.1 5-methyltetrahydropteroyltriglutamate--homocysteine methyltransferase [Mucilaginibacter phyllosphaerae]TEW64237.1 5-methyltetrahydropteroyltriglutamate--homocysteine S-methyltransferase [Mucilaginibacter phyllosphaerae]GGH04838.1 5-methyltetrahydropteroyltriglutamate--homocysteine methyltransferase [Mucilaginibacter phyllosphaerae]
MLTQNLGYPRIGSQRELKKVCEGYWAGKTGHKNVLTVGKTIRHDNWQMQKDVGIDLIPSNDFSYYDHVLDHSLMFGAIPKRYNEVMLKQGNEELDLYFAMARGYQKNGLDVVAMEMTKWFDTNYHYIVPEFYKNQQFKVFSTKITNEFYEAKQLGIITKPVLIGPVTYLLLGKEKEAGFEKIDLLKNLLPVYTEILSKLQDLGAEWIQFDEPFLALDLNEKEQQAYRDAYKQLRKDFPRLKFVLTTYFEKLGSNAELAASLPIDALHIDLVRAPQQLNEVLDLLPAKTILSLGLVDGRNVWKNDFDASLAMIKKATEKLGHERVWIAPSCSLIHSPVDLKNEHNTEVLTPQIKQWLAFARQKVNEIALLKSLSANDAGVGTRYKLAENQHDHASRKTSALIHNVIVKQRVKAITESDSKRSATFASRKQKQQQLLNLPLFATTTIGSFPQTAEVRSWRAQLKKGAITQEQYNTCIAEETQKAVKWQEEIDLDVLVHGEFERNDMVEYFGEQLQGFTFTQNGWVQSYGSRCVKPPIIYGDVSRPTAITVKWSAYAQSLTDKWMKGMLTGPVTILQWSFVRNDQPRSETCTQIALAIRDEVCDLEQAGIKIIQIDEPAIREGLPLRKADHTAYLDWAVKAFRISASGVQDDTQIHTHMCYSEFNDIIQNIAAMDADVITIETSRSQMELLDVFADFKYPNEIGPGVYDIHSPRVPNKDEMTHLLKKARAVIPDKQLWVNPDCGLKTRGWDETKKALIEMVAAAKEMRATVEEPLTI